MGTGRGTRARRAGIFFGAIACVLAFAPGASANTFSAGAGGAIPDGTTCDYGAPLDVPINVSGMNLRPGDVAVTITFNPQHTWVGDLDVTLVAPDNTSKTIFSRTGASSSLDNGSPSDVVGPYTFSDRATNPPDGGWWQAAEAGGDNATIPSGTYRATAPGGPGQTNPAPPTLISPTFANTDPNGTWHLVFRDHCTGDTGSVSAATLTLANTYEVTNLSASDPGSLADAITQANANPGLDVVKVDNALTGTIDIPGTQMLTDDVDIRGPGAAQLNVDAGTGLFGIFTVSNDVDASISQLTVTGGSAGTGAGINNQGDLTLDHVHVTDNHATGTGGGVFNFGDANSLTIRDSTMSGNSAPSGGGIGTFNLPNAAPEKVTIERTTIDHNSSSNHGAGLYIGDSAATIVSDSTIADNTADTGNGPGGGIYLDGDDSDVSLQNSTVSGNAGATTISVSGGGALMMSSSIVSDTQGIGTSNCNVGAEISNGYNIADDSSCQLTQGTDQAGVDPRLGPLQVANGGPTATMAPAPNSLAIDRGTTNSLALDERGELRAVDMPGATNAPGGQAADVGAVELQTSDVPQPSVFVTDGPMGTTSDNEPLFKFAEQNATQLECSIDQGTPLYGTCSAPDRDTPSTPLADGTYTFRVRATTITGAEAADTRSFTVDTTAPSPSVNGGPTGTTGNRTPSFSFFANEPSTFACRIVPSVGSPPAFATCSGPGQTHAPAAPLADGSYTFEVRATDAADNTSTAASRSFTVDGSAPSVSASGPTGPTADSTPTFGFSSTDTVSFDCRIVVAGQSPPAFSTCSGPGLTHTPATALADGSYTFEVRATDAGSNSATDSRSFTVDTAPPLVSVDSGPSGNTGDATPTFGFSAGEPSTFVCRIVPSVGSPPAFGSCSGPGQTHTPASPLADGSYTFEVRGADNAGNVGTDSQAFTVDSAAPSVSIDSGPTGPTTNTTPAFGFSSTDQVTFACRITETSHAPAGFAACAGPGNTHSPAAALADGSYTFEARATDAAGNSATESRSFTVDTTAPTVAVDSGPKGPTLDQTPTFSFSAGEPATFACRLSAAGQKASDFASCSGPGQTHSPGSIPDGSYTFEVRATDAAGNTSTSSRAFKLTATACRQALNDVIAANGVLATAYGKLAKAKASGNAKKIKKAKKALKKAKKAEAGIKHDVSQLCVTSDG